jgi:superfamily II DNA or RNA helicase/intein/homing endonuclease
VTEDEDSEAAPDASPPDDTPFPDSSQEDSPLDEAGFTDVIQDIGRPVVTASHVSQSLDCSQSEATDALAALAEDGPIRRLDVSGDPVVWYPTDWSRLTDRERVIVFPGRREIVVDHPTQFTRAQLSQFAHLVDTTHRGGYLYEIRREDVWNAPYDDFEGLLTTFRDVLPERSPELEEWLEDQWKRAHQFTLRTHEDGYVVLEAATENLMGNVAREKLDDGQLRAPISDSESWVAAESVAEVKRILYEAGYPVQDERDLDTGEALDLQLNLELRDYQHEWVSAFIDRKAGVLVGPPGSGKTVAAMGILERVGGETVILVPGRELASQWKDELLARTTLQPDQVGEYHGGTKEVRPVTIATYQTAGMDRHRELFDSREWGLIIYDEVHHIPAPVARRSANLQSKHRLGLSVKGDTQLPVRRDGAIQMLTIEEFTSQYLGEDTGISSVDDAETLSVTAEGEVRWTDVRSVMRHEHGDEMCKVRATNGREITVTPDHSLIVFDGDSMDITAKSPGDLTDTDYLLQPASLPQNADDSATIDILELVDAGYVLLGEDTPDDVFDPLYERQLGTNKSRYNWKTRKNLPVDIAREIDVSREYIEGVYTHGRHSYIPPELPVEDFARLVGLFVADGAIDDHRVEFYARDDDGESEVEEFEEVIRAVCPEVSINSIANGENCRTLRVTGILCEVFKKIGLSNGARTKHIPSIILSNPQAYEPFIEGVELGDGHRQLRERNRVTVNISTSSDRLRAGLTLVLSALGHIGGNYRRDTTVPMREREHDTVPNNLVRFNPNNRESPSRKEMVPFTETLENAYEAIPRYEPQYTDGGSTIESGLSNRKRLNGDELGLLLERSNLECDWLLETDVAMLEVDSVDSVESEEYVYDIDTEEDNFLGNNLFCHNSSTPVREDDREEDIYTLIGPPIGTDWDSLFDAGFVAEPEVEIRYVPWADEDTRNQYVSADGHERRQLAATNPAKVPEVRQVLSRHPEKKALVFVEYIEQGEDLAAALDAPFISGEMPHSQRQRHLQEFRQGTHHTLVVSRVGDEGIDLPDAELAVVASGLGGSRRQGAQRAGRTMRPTGQSLVYVLATRGSNEEEFAQRRMRHLASKGVRVSESEAETHD